MVNYKLIYFPGRGRAEPMRMLFAAAGVSFEEEKITMESWPTVKPTTLWGSLPMLEIDGKRYGQSKAITFYLAEEFGFLGKTSMDHLQIAQVCEACSDVFMAAVKILWSKESDEEKNKMKEEAKKGSVLPTFKQLNNLAQENGYFVGDSITLADIVLYHTMDTVHRVMHGGSIRGKRDARAPIFDKLKKVLNHVEDHPAIGKYLNERYTQDTFF